MPLDANKNGISVECDAPAIWVLPPALRQLAEGGDMELVEELLAMFQVDTASRLELMQRALASRDKAALSAEAHTIKGSAMQVGANRVAEICQLIEAALRNNPEADISANFTQLLQSFDEVCSFFASRGEIPQNQSS